jgi:CheY-like chemotaxis protein
MPDVLILDYHLDRGDTGVALAEELRTLTRTHLPLVVVTADAAEAVCEEVEAADGVYLRKPVKPLALRSVLRRVVLHDAQRSKESGSAS